jgi:AcrR family transcriptional regulator
MPAAPTTKKGRRTREAVLKAAGRVFARDGYVDARMLDIAEEAGLSAGGLYRYFENKSDVFAALIKGIHEEFYELSGRPEHTLEEDPLTALNEANRGYIEHYYKNRDVMRSFIEAAAVDEDFLAILQDMRARHIERSTKAMSRVPGIEAHAGLSPRVLIEAVTFMVEQCCYVWFAQRSGDGSPPRQEVSVDEAIANLSYVWYATLFEPHMNGDSSYDVKDASPALSTSVSPTDATKRT